MVNPTLGAPLPLPSSPLPPPEDTPNPVPQASRAGSFTHPVCLALMATITPLVVLVNCLDRLQGIVVTIPMQTALALVRPSYTSSDYLGVYAKVLWTYGSLGPLAQPSRCQPADLPGSGRASE